jgi:hypothetical protein
MVSSIKEVRMMTDSEVHYELAKIGGAYPDMNVFPKETVREFVKPFLLYKSLHPITKKRNMLRQTSSWDYLMATLVKTDLQHLCSLMDLPHLANKQDIKKKLKENILKAAFGDNDAYEVLKTHNRKLGTVTHHGPSLKDLFGPSITGLRDMDTLQVDDMIQACKTHDIDVAMWDNIQEQTWEDSTKNDALRVLIWDRCHTIPSKRNSISNTEDILEKLSVKRKQVVTDSVFLEQQRKKRKYTKVDVHMLEHYITKNIQDPKITEEFVQEVVAMKYIHPEWSDRMCFVKLKDSTLLTMAQHDPIWCKDYGKRKTFAKSGTITTKKSNRERFFNWNCRELITHPDGVSSL